MEFELGKYIAWNDAWKISLHNLPVIFNELKIVQGAG